MNGGIGLSGVVSTMMYRDPDTTDAGVAKSKLTSDVGEAGLQPAYEGTEDAKTVFVASAEPIAPFPSDA